jgi:uncharacterized membrane protein (UPF0127 family)
MKNLVLIVGLLILLGLAFFISQTLVNQGPLKIFNLTRQTKAKAIINHRTFTLIVAETDEEKRIGLSLRKSLPKDYGMLFQFEHEDFHPFWMRNMKFPIDILFIRNNKIVTIYRNVQPPQSPSDVLILYRPAEPSDKVIEINANLSDEYGFKVGDEITLEFS